MFASCKCVTASVYAGLLCCFNAKESQSVQCVATSKPDEIEHIATSQIACVLHANHRPVLILDVNLLQVRKYVMEEVNEAGKAKKLRGFEMIKSVLLDEEAWSGMQAPSSYHTSPQ